MQNHASPPLNQILSGGADKTDVTIKVILWTLHVEQVRTPLDRHTLFVKVGKRSCRVSSLECVVSQCDSKEEMQQSITTFSLSHMCTAATMGKTFRIQTLATVTFRIQTLATVNVWQALTQLVEVHSGAIASPNQTARPVGRGWHTPSTGGASGEIANDNHLNSATMLAVPLAPACVGKMIEKAPKECAIHRRHSAPKESEDQFFVGTATTMKTNNCSSPKSER